MEYDEERKIREEERKRAVKIIVKYFDGSNGALMNIKLRIYEGRK